MALQSIINKAMWAVYNQEGDILFGTIAHTKEESEKLFKTYYRPSFYSERTYSCLMIAIDIIPIE